MAVPLIIACTLAQHPFSDQPETTKAMARDTKQDSYRCRPITSSEDSHWQHPSPEFGHCSLCRTTQGSSTQKS
ncbi:hypothetical protein BDR06DRAFT_959683 [Suillus hirtellus]|nr:hypothetical protein BDR06DRAFT_959683 [Suillus hirtellus]